MRQRNYLLTSDRSERFKQSKEFKLTGGKRTLRGNLIERRGSSEAWYGGDNPRRKATPCFGTQPHCLQVQLARHCLLANDPSASVAPKSMERATGFEPRSVAGSALKPASPAPTKGACPLVRSPRRGHPPFVTPLPRVQKEITCGKRTLRREVIERGGSTEGWYGGDNPRREATPCFGTQPDCL